jgi:hypothetical protein
MFGKALFALVASGASVLFAASAGASPSSRLIYVRSPSASTCPDEASFRTAVTRRIGYDPFFPWAKIAVVVEVAGNGPEFVAHLVLVDEHGLSRGIRELRSGPRGCESVVDAAALAISIALDMNAPASGGLASSPSPAPPPPPQTIDVAPTPLAVPATLPPHATEAGGRASDDAAEARRRRHSESPTRIRGAVGVDALVAIADAPRAVLPGLDVWAAARRGFGSLELELRGDAPDSAAFARGGRANIVFVAATLAPCATAGPFFACALGSVGWLHATGSDVTAARSGAAYAAAVGPRAGIEWPLGRSFALRVRGDWLIHVVRPGVSVNGEAWPMPPFGGVVAVGAAYRFP